MTRPDFFDAPIIRSASISPCGAYRYDLTRRWAPGAPMPFVMLNPSAADGEVDDPTIRRCMSFARREGHGGIVVANLYALRASEPAALWRHENPIGPKNWATLVKFAVEALEADTPVVCAWGAHGSRQGKDAPIISMLKTTGARLVCLGKTKDGHPRHPLYVRTDHPLEPFP